MNPTSLRWKAYEFDFVKKSIEWFWALWIIAVSVSVASILLDNILLAVLVLLIAAVLTMTANKPPRELDYEISSVGVKTGKTLYPFTTLESYWIEHAEVIGRPHGRLLIKSKKLLMTLIVVPLGTIPPEEVGDALSEKLPAEEHHESIFQRILEYLGF